MTKKRKQPLQATLTKYGKRGQVEYYCCAIHNGSQIVEHRFVDVSQLTLQQALKELVAFVSSFKVKTIRKVSVLFPSSKERKVELGKTSDPGMTVNLSFLSA